MTGVSSHTLRKWESRYSLIRPERTDTGRRMYDSADITRLLAIRELVNQGFLPSQLAELKTEELQARINRETPNASPRINEGVLDVVGAVLSAQFHGVVTSPNLVINSHEVSTEDWLQDHSTIKGATVLECPSVSTKLVDRLLARTALESPTLTIVYGFASTQSLRRLRKAGIVCLQAPVSVTDLIETEHYPPLPPKRRYTDKQISELLTIRPSIDCECPNHIAQLLIGLNAFEKYSQECENANPTDKALHSYLGELTGHARGLLEQAADRVVEAEAISFGTDLQ